MEDVNTILKGAWRRLRYLFSRFSADRCSENAAALTYMSLFALVPLITVSYTMAAAVPAFQGLEEQINAFMYDNLLPDTSTEIQGYLSEFSQQAKNLTGVGIGFLVVTAILMLRNIEKAFNAIWRTQKNRSAVSSFLLYWAVLTLAPLTIGVALGINTYLASFTVIFEDIEMVAGTGLKRPFISFIQGRETRLPQLPAHLAHRVKRGRGPPKEIEEGLIVRLMLHAHFSSRANRLDVSQRPPPIACTSA